MEDFLYDEAELLDSWRLEEWFSLFTEDCRYWVPSNTDDQDPASAVYIIHDDWQQLRDRVTRLHSPLVHSQQPRARTRRLISNIRVVAVDGPEVWVTSNFLLYEVRLNRERILGGRYEHVLRQANDAWRILHKKVALLTNDTPAAPISLLL